jgi:4-hydroxybenzoate polyprenyltransferase
MKALEQARRLLPWLRSARLHRPADLGLLWLLGLWGLWLGGNGQPAPSAVILLLLSLLGLRSLAWLVHDLAVALLVHPRHSLADVLRGLPLPLRWLAGVELALALLPLLLLGWPTLVIALAGAVLGVTFLALRRRTFLGELLLALACACATLAGFSAAGAVPGKTAWLVYTAAVLWIGAALTQYAALHLPQHARLDIKSITMLFGRADRGLVALLQLFALAALWLAGQQEKLGVFMHIALAVGAALGLYQQYLMASASDPGYRRAWRNNLWFGLALFCGMAFSFLCKFQTP